MNKQEVLQGAKELTDNIFKNMRVLETCDAVIDSIKGLTVCYTDNDSKIVTLDGVLSKEQLDKITDSILSEITNNMKQAMTFLQEKTQQPAFFTEESTHDEYEETEEEIPTELPFVEVPQDNVKKAGMQPTELSEEAIGALVKYYSDGATVADVCREFHISTKRAHDILVQYNVLRSNVQKKEKKEVPKPSVKVERKKCEKVDYEKATKMRESGMPVGDIAEKLGCAKKTLYNYFQIQGIACTPSKPSVEYIGKGKN